LSKNKILIEWKCGGAQMFNKYLNSPRFKNSAISKRNLKGQNESKEPILHVKKIHFNPKKGLMNELM
jgi:hypothetical protein